MKALLIVIAISSTSSTWLDLGTENGYRKVGPYEFATMEDCRASVGTARIEAAKGGDAEAGVVLVCVPNEGQGR